MDLPDIDKKVGEMMINHDDDFNILDWLPSMIYGDHNDEQNTNDKLLLFCMNIPPSKE